MVRSCCSSRGCLSEGMQILTIGDAGGWSRCLLDVARVPFFPALHHAGGETPAPGLVTAVVRDWLARERSCSVMYGCLSPAPGSFKPRRSLAICVPAGDRSHARQPPGVFRLISPGVCCAAAPPHGHQTMPGGLFFCPPPGLLPVARGLGARGCCPRCSSGSCATRSRLSVSGLPPTSGPRRPGAGSSCCGAGGPFLSGPPQPVAQSVSGFPPGKTGTRPMIWRVRTSWRLPFMTLKPFHLCAPM